MKGRKITTRTTMSWPRAGFASSERKEERGSCLLEFAAVVPLLVFTLFSGIETARALGSYLRLSQIAYEGARYAASLPGLEEGDYSVDSPPPLTSTQSRLRAVVFDIVKEYNLDATLVQLDTQYLADPGDGTPVNRVLVELEANYQPLFGIGFPSIPIRVSATSPYLFPES